MRNVRHIIILAIVAICGGCASSRMTMRGHGGTTLSRRCENQFCVNAVESSPPMKHADEGLIVEKTTCEHLPDDQMCKAFPTRVRMVVFNNTNQTIVFGHGLNIMEMSVGDLPAMMAVYGTKYESGESSTRYLDKGDPRNVHRTMLPDQKPPHGECEHTALWRFMTKAAPLTGTNDADTRVIPKQQFGKSICINLM